DADVCAGQVHWHHEVAISHAPIGSMPIQMDAYVFGRLSADLYPLQINTPLEEVRTFERFVGGFAGNVATGLARLGVAVAIVSAVGEDGHGHFVRRFL